MSNTVKLNLSIIGAAIAILSTCCGIIWMAAQKAGTIDTVESGQRTMQAEFSQFKSEFKEVNATVSRLDERTQMMLTMQRDVSARFEDYVRARNSTSMVRANGH